MRIVSISRREPLHIHHYQYRSSPARGGLIGAPGIPSCTHSRRSKPEVGNDFDFAASNAKFEKATEQEVKVGYNKSSGFFDTISCEASRGFGRFGTYGARNGTEEEKKIKRPTVQTERRIC